MLVDCHAHVQFKSYKDDADEVIARAREAGVKMVCPSSELNTAKRGIEYAEKYPKDIWAAVGLHPIHLKPQHVDAKEGIPAYETRGVSYDRAKWRPLAEHLRVVAVGEVGFDYDKRFAVSTTDRDRQEEVFREQIELALEVKKPIIQHCRSGPVYPDGEPRAASDSEASLATTWWRDANKDALRVLAEYVPRGLRGLIHCYSGDMEQAKRYLDLGFLLSFTGLITFNDSWDDVIRAVPLDRITVETDAPYLTPAPHRGTRNEPAYVRYVAERIAELKNVPFEEVAGQTTKNAQRIFGISFDEQEATG